MSVFIENAEVALGRGVSGSATRADREIHDKRLINDEDAALSTQGNGDKSRTRGLDGVRVGPCIVCEAVVAAIAEDEVIGAEVDLREERGDDLLKFFDIVFGDDGGGDGVVAFLGNGVCGFSLTVRDVGHRPAIQKQRDDLWMLTGGDEVHESSRVYPER